MPAAPTLLEKLLAAIGQGSAGSVLRRTGTGLDDFEMGALDADADSPGYVKLPGGITVQWGESTATASDTTAITLPVAFGTAGLACFVSHKHPVSVHADPLAVGFTSVSALAVTNPYSDAMAFYWFAIGH